MAILTKSRARKALASHRLFRSWSNGKDGVRFNLAVLADTEHTYTMALTESEGCRTAVDFAGYLTADPREVWPDKRSNAQKLRDLADKLERERDGKCS